jgi:Cu/Ag efflux protein CusF
VKNARSFGSSAAAGVCLAALVVLCALPAACKRKSTPPPQWGQTEFIAPATPAEQTYTVRARVVSLPSETSQYLQVHHEAIPDFVGGSGEVVGMEEMTMPFPWMHPLIDLAVLKPGDVVAITFEVRYKADPRSLVTKIEKLPAETTLNFDKR